MAYGGGKTHTLITLLHLAERGTALAQHRTVREFTIFAGLTTLPQARVALLPGDKLDVKKGLVVIGPDGTTKTIRTLWGALAYQLAGESGYQHLLSHDEEFTVPAEPLLVDLLNAPVKEGLGALVLVDEAVWYYRSAVEALTLRLFELTSQSGGWPCSPVAADQVQFQLIEAIELSPETILSAVAYTVSSSPTLKEIKETIERQFFAGREIPLDLFQSQVQAAIAQGKLSKLETGAGVDSLAGLVRLPDVVLYGDAVLDPAALQNLAEQIIELLSLAPELSFSFRVGLSAEGQKPDPDTLDRLNALLEEIKPGWRLG